MAGLSKTEAELIEAQGQYFDDPLGWAFYAFDWEKDPDLHLVQTPAKFRHVWKCEYGLDLWAMEFLYWWGEEIKQNGFDGKKAVKAIQAAVASGHGIGKSALTAIIILYILSTRPHSRGVITANTSDQLKTKTWAELGKWRKKCITGHWFEYNNGKGNMNLYHKDHPTTWRADAQTCREENSESFAGLHAATSSPFYIFDEASAIPDAIWEVAEGGVTDGEPFWFCFGNPTRNSGRFRKAFRELRHRWKTWHVDSRTVQITNKEKIEEWRKDYGEDSDFFKVRVRGVFPSQSIKQFFPEALVEAARGKHIPPHQYDFAAKILTVDPAWEGDDMFEIGIRQGLSFRILKTLPKNSNDVEMAHLIAKFEDEEGADGVNIDAGYGTGIYSIGQSWGRDWNLVWFGGKSNDPGYLNKRAEMAGATLKWLQAGGAIPDDDDMFSDIVSIETVPRVDGKIQLESKKDMKARGLPSPGKLDILMLSFAFPIEKKEKKIAGLNRKEEICENDYDPFNSD